MSLIFDWYTSLLYYIIRLNYSYLYFIGDSKPGKHGSITGTSGGLS